MADLQSAWKLHQEGRLDEALAAYDALLVAQPRNPALLHYAGVASYQRGDLATALDRLRAAVNIDGRDADAWSNLGLVLMAIGHHVAAAEVFAKALALVPSVSEIEANLVTLNETFRLPQIPDLVSRKLAGPEKGTLDDRDFAFHESEYTHLRAALEEAMMASTLPENSSAKPALHDLLLRLRG